MSKEAEEQGPSQTQLREFVESMKELLPFCGDPEDEEVELPEFTFEDGRVAQISMPYEDPDLNQDGDYSLQVVKVENLHGSEVKSKTDYIVVVRHRSEGIKYSDHGGSPRYYERDEEGEWQPVLAPWAVAMNASIVLKEEGLIKEAQERRQEGLRLWAQYIEAEPLLGQTRMQHYLGAVGILGKIKETYGLG